MVINFLFDSCDFLFVRYCYILKLDIILKGDIFRIF